MGQHFEDAVEDENGNFWAWTGQSFEMVEEEKSSK